MLYACLMCLILGTSELFVELKDKKTLEPKRPIRLEDAKDQNSQKLKDTKYWKMQKTKRPWTLKDPKDEKPKKCSLQFLYPKQREDTKDEKKNTKRTRSFRSFAH